MKSAALRNKFCYDHFQGITSILSRLGRLVQSLELGPSKSKKPEKIYIPLYYIYNYHPIRHLNVSANFNACGYTHPPVCNPFRHAIYPCISPPEKFFEISVSSKWRKLPKLQKFAKVAEGIVGSRSAKLPKSRSGVVTADDRNRIVFRSPFNPLGECYAR